MTDQKHRIGELFKHRGFLLLWFGQTVSRVGNLVYDAAIGFTVYTLTGSSLSVGAVLGSFSIAQLVSLLLGGVVGDRFSRRKVVLISDIVAATVTILLAASIATKHITLLGLCLLSASLGVLSAFHLPAYRAILPEVLDQEQIHSANAVMAVSNSVTRIVGPGVGGILITWFGVMGAFALDALSFVVAVIAMIFTPLPRRTGVVKVSRNSGLRAEVAEGIRQVVRVAWLRDVMLIGALTNVLVLGPVTVLIPVIVSNEKLPSLTLGLVPAAQGLGTVLANLILIRFSKRWASAPMVIGLSLVFGAAAIALSFSSSLAIWLPAGLLIGVGMMTSTLKQTLIQSQIPQEYLGRIFSLDMISSFALLPASYAMAGVGSQLIGSRSVVLWAGVVEIIVCIVLLVPRRIMIWQAFRSNPSAVRHD